MNFGYKNKIIINYKKSEKNIGKSQIVYNQLKGNSKNLIFITDGDNELSPENIKYYLNIIFQIM